jgi:hypothetical protein
MADKPNPVPLAMLICDTVIDDRKTGKKSVIGMFNSITTEKVPTSHPRLSIFVALTDGHGEYKAALRFICVEDNKVVAEMTGPVVFKDPRQVVEFNFELVGMPLTKFGAYQFDFMCNGNILISRRLTVSQMPQPQQGGEGKAGPG